MKIFFKNSLWIIFERAFFMLGSFFITVLVGRYLGAEKLGVITYALSISSILIIITELGCSHTIYNRLKKNKCSAINLINISFHMRICIYILLLIPVLLSLYNTNHNYENLIVISLIILASLFSALDLYQYYFNGVLKSKINAVSSQIAFGIVIVSRYILVEFKFGFLWFVLPIFLQYFITFIIRLYFFSKEAVLYKKNKVKNIFLYRKYILRTGFPLVMSGVSIVLYTKINNFMLSEILGNKILGLFSVSQALSQVWVFLPNAIIVSFLTKILSEKRENLVIGLSFINILLLLIFAPFFIIYIFYAKEIVYYSFGSEFIKSSEIMVVLSIAGLFGCAGFLNNRVLSSLGLYRFLLYKTITIGLCSIPISYFLISLYGFYGAAISVLIIEILGSCIINYFFCKEIYYSHIGMFQGFRYFNIIKRHHKIYLDG